MKLPFFLRRDMRFDVSLFYCGVAVVLNLAADRHLSDSGWHTPISIFCMVMVFIHMRTVLNRLFGTNI